MNSRTVKILLITLLSIFILVLLYIYFLSGEKLKPESVQTENLNVNFRDKFLRDIDSVIFSFGIKKDWIRETSGKGKDPAPARDSLLISREVRIPSDLATIDLNYEITNYLRSVNLDVNVVEDPKSRNLSMNIFSLKDSIRKPAGSLKFIITDTLKRNASEVCIILDSLDIYSLDEVESILNSTQAYSVILPVRNDKADYQSKIVEYRKDYLLKFSVGNEDDIEADFKTGMKESQWRAKVRSVSVNFPKTGGIILINNGANAELYNAVREEFVKNNISVFPESIITYVRNSGDKINSLFEIISESKNGNKFLILDVNLTPSEFKSYDSDVYALKKSGYKFYDFKEMIRRMQKSK